MDRTLKVRTEEERRGWRSDGEEQKRVDQVGGRTKKRRPGRR